MRTDLPGVDWLLDCTPRPAQLEALARSYTGVAYREHKGDELNPRRLPHHGRPSRGWGHFMEMRVGKTPTALNEFELFRRDHGMKRLFMLGPNKYKGTWALETQRFGVVIPTYVFESSDRKDFATFMRTNPEAAVFANYEALIQEENRKLFEEFIGPGTYFGADEAVALKNTGSHFFTHALALSKEASIVRPLTGKPTPQSVVDLYAQFKLLGQLDGWNKTLFQATFAEKGGYKGKVITGVKNLDRLERLRFQSFFFARRADWATTLEPDLEIIPLQMSPKQREHYQSMEDEFMVWLDSGEVVSVDQVITKHMKLQQISSGFIIDQMRQVQWLMSFDETPKFKELMDRLENGNLDKALIIFNYAATGDGLIQSLAKFNPAVIRGGEWMKKNGRDTDAEKNRFNNDPACRVMIGQSKAIKYGHTLMGSPEDPCLTIYFFENNYSLDDRSQVEQRPEGDGQVAPINRVDFVSTPIERVVIGALQHKEEIASKIMGYYKGDKQ